MSDNAKVTLTREQADEVMRVLRNALDHERACHQGGPIPHAYEHDVKVALTLLGRAQQEPAVRCFGCEDRPFGAIWAPDARPHTCEKSMEPKQQEPAATAGRTRLDAINRLRRCRDAHQATDVTCTHGEDCTGCWAFAAALVALQDDPLPHLPPPAPVAACGCAEVLSEAAECVSWMAGFFLAETETCDPERGLKYRALRDRIDSALSRCAGGEWELVREMGIIESESGQRISGYIFDVCVRSDSRNLWTLHHAVAKAGDVVRVYRRRAKAGG